MTKDEIHIDSSLEAIRQTMMNKNMPESCKHNSIARDIYTLTVDATLAEVRKALIVI